MTAKKFDSIIKVTTDASLPPGSQPVTNETSTSDFLGIRVVTTVRPGPDVFLEPDVVSPTKLIDREIQVRRGWPFS